LPSHGSGLPLNGAQTNDALAERLSKCSIAYFIVIEGLDDGFRNLDVTGMLLTKLAAKAAG
jgi:hypothetical protein